MDRAFRVQADKASAVAMQRAFAGRWQKRASRSTSGSLGSGRRSSWTCTQRKSGSATQTRDMAKPIEACALFRVDSKEEVCECSEAARPPALVLTHSSTAPASWSSSASTASYSSSSSSSSSSCFSASSSASSSPPQQWWRRQRKASNALAEAPDAESNPTATCCSPIGD